MHIEHIAVWTGKLEELKDFYATHFKAIVGEKYTDPQIQFESYFLQIGSGPRLELMHMPGLHKSLVDPGVISIGITHLSFSVGSMEQVDKLTAQLETQGCQVVDRPHHTGDGYYESCVLDPDGNRLEISV